MGKRRVMSFSPTVKRLPQLALYWAAIADRLGPDYPSTRCLLGWGAKRSSRWPRAMGLPCVALEEGFLRSLKLAPSAPLLSLVFDELGIYYDARRPSRLESLIVAAQDSTGECARAEALRAAWVAGRVTKYNHAREPNEEPQPRNHVLVIDQTWGDLSISGGLASAGSFTRMLEAALDEHPGRPVVVKIHPQVLAGRKRGYLTALPRHGESRIRVVGEDLHLPFFLEHAHAVYTVTSQVGFEALLWNKTVRVFGMPFYAGWGLTQDDLPSPSRRQKRSLTMLVHAALIDYPVYIDQGRGCISSAEDTLARVVGYRRREGLLV
jgi:capsular polysaccharide export protein